jgi:hypothetical protein
LDEGLTETAGEGTDQPAGHTDHDRAALVQNSVCSGWRCHSPTIPLTFFSDLFADTMSESFVQDEDPNMAPEESGLPDSCLSGHRISDRDF